MLKEHSAAFSLFEVNIYSIKLTNEPFSVIALFLDRPKCGWGFERLDFVSVTLDEVLMCVLSH